MKEILKEYKAFDTISKEAYIGGLKQNMIGYVVLETSDILILYMEFVANQYLMEERHSPFEKVFCLKGKITYVIDKEEFLVNEGECIEISSFRLHESKAGEHGAQLLVMLMKNQYFENFFEN